MKTVKSEEPVARSRFIDCPSCKTHTLKLKRVVQVGRCKSCHESYKIVVVYVREGKKRALSPAKTAPATANPVPESTLPSWQVPSDNSLFGSMPADSSSIFSDNNSLFGEDEKKNETPTGSGQ